MNFFDRLVERFCDALALRATDSMWLLRQPAVVFAGFRPISTLPSDRRPIAFAATKTGEQTGRKYTGTDREDRILAEGVCNNDENCYLHGFPCACCGGSRTTCPSGASAGSYWSFCCNHVLIRFQDCCGNVACPDACPFCNNSDQPNWCQGAPTSQYACTMTIPVGTC
jgi:hypothetical protein